MNGGHGNEKEIRSRRIENEYTKEAEKFIYSLLFDDSSEEF
jgi:hypothetical protein